MKGRKKGTPKSGGRKEGTPNKTTAEARALFVSIMNDEIDNIKEALVLIRKESPAKYCDALAKLFQYTMPKQLDIKSDTIIEYKNVSKQFPDE
jgi:hypothetical protein